MWWGLLINMAAGIFGLWLSARFVPGVAFTGPLFVVPNLSNIGPFLDSLVLVGAVLGFLNNFIKPILNRITFPLRIITFNISSLIFSMLLVWLVDIFSPPLIINGLKALFFTTLIVWGLNLLLSSWLPDKPRRTSSPNA